MLQQNKFSENFLELQSKNVWNQRREERLVFWKEKQIYKDHRDFLKSVNLVFNLVLMWSEIYEL